MLIISNMGDHVWLMTSRQTLPLLPPLGQFFLNLEKEGRKEGKNAHSSSILGWNMRLTKPMDGLL